MEGYYFVPDCEFVEKEYKCLFNEDLRKDMTLDEKCKKVIDLFNDDDHFIPVGFGEGVDYDLSMYNRINDRGDIRFSYDNDSDDWTDETDLDDDNWKKFSETKKQNYVDWITEGKIEPTKTFCKHHFLGNGWMVQLHPDWEHNDEYYDEELCCNGLWVIMDKCIDLTSKYENKLKEKQEKKKGKKCKKAKKWNTLIKAIKENEDNEDYCIWDTLEELGVCANGEDA